MKKLWKWIKIGKKEVEGLTFKDIIEGVEELIDGMDVKNNGVEDTITQMKNEIEICVNKADKWINKLLRT